MTDVLDFAEWFFSMMDGDFECSHCGEEIFVDEIEEVVDQEKKTFICPHCDGVVEAQ